MHETYGNRIYMSLMSQYTPLGESGCGKISGAEPESAGYAYEKLVDYADLAWCDAGVYTGRDTAKESFIPPFTLEGV